MPDHPGRRWPSLGLLSLFAFSLGFGVVAAWFALTTSEAKAYHLDENNCLACHSDPKLTKKNGQGKVISLYVDEGTLSTSAHRYIDCTRCHTTEPHQTPTLLTKLSLAQRCGTCHEYEARLHLTSVHGEQLLKGNPDVATCVDCHSEDANPHAVFRVLDPVASAYPKNIAETCAKCHGNPELMGKYGIVERVYESYMRSFHGKATKLSPDISAQLNKATCVSCHGTHDIKDVSDPTAPVAGMANLAKTCERCHADAGVDFARGFLGHKEADPSHLAPVYWGERFFFLLTTVALSMGALLVSLEVTRWAIGKLRGEGKESHG